MFFSYKKFQSLTWYVAELCAWALSVEARLSANADAIEAVVANLKAAETRINAKIAAVQAAADAGEDLSAPLADLTAEVGNISNIAPAPVEAPVEPVVGGLAPNS